MKGKNFAKSLVDKLRIIENEPETIKLITDVVFKKQSLTIGFLNQHALNLACKDLKVYQDIFALDLLLRDGKGIEIACKFFNRNPGINLNGTDFIPRFTSFLNDSGHDFNYFVFGTDEPWLEKGGKKLLHGNQFISKHGFLSEKEYCEIYQQNEAIDATNIVILAMGMPKQESLANEIRLIAKGRVVVICGGAIVDFEAGRVTRAPQMMRKIGLEWFYRLIKEPRRLFKRYVVGIPLFFFYLIIKR